MTVYNKAIRDRIPEIIESDGKKPVVEILGDEEFLVELEKKLGEEIDEYLAGRKVEELVDVEEVLLRILELRGVAPDAFEEMRLEKRRKRGGFDSNLFLKAVLDGEDSTNDSKTPDLLQRRKEAIDYWSKKYDVDHPWWVEREAVLGEKIRREGCFDKQILRNVVEWKFDTLPGRKKKVLGLIENNSEERILSASRDALSDGRSDIERVKALDSLVGVGPALASTVLTFWDPNRFCVLDIHVWREVFGGEPKDLFASPRHYIDLLEVLRGEAAKYGCNIRTLEKALFKKNLDESR